MQGCHCSTHSLYNLCKGVIRSKDPIQKRQIDFLRKFKKQSFYEDSPLKLAITMAQRYKSPMGLYIRDIETLLEDPVTEFTHMLHTKVRSSEASKVVIYRAINPELSVHPMYNSNDFIPKSHRIATSRLRLSSHRLRIETGQWSCTPREERLCQCEQDIQTESHVMLDCERSRPLRQNLRNINFDSIAQLMDNSPCAVLCKLCYDVLSLY